MSSLLSRHLYCYESICYTKAQDESETWKWTYPREEKSEYFVLNSCFQEGGPIGLVENDDIITIDIQKRRMDVDLTEEQFAERRKKWTPPSYKATRGVLYKVCKTNCDSLSKNYVLSSLFIWSRICHPPLQYIKNVQPASRGCVTDEKWF